MSTVPAQINVNNVTISMKRDGFLVDEAIATQVKRRGTDRLRILGTDLWMMGTMDLVEEQFLGAFEEHDLSRAAGMYNYAQAITHRLMTSRGTHPQDRFFGVPWLNYLGRRYISSDVVKSSLIQDITDELYKDSRTKEVVAVEAEFENPNTISVKCIVVPVGVNDEFIELGLSVRNNITV